MVEQECGPTRDPPQPASIDMGLHIGNGVSLDAADDAGDVPHRRNVRVSDVPCDGRTAPERGTYSRPNTRTGLRPSFASMHKGVQNTVPKHRSPQGRARTRARRHRSDFPPLRTLTQTMLEVYTQAFTRCSSILALRMCSWMHEGTILHVDESTTPFLVRRSRSKRHARHVRMHAFAC